MIAEAEQFFSKHPDIEVRKKGMALYKLLVAMRDLAVFECHPYRSKDHHLTRWDSCHYGLIKYARMANGGSNKKAAEWLGINLGSFTRIAKAVGLGANKS